MHALCPSFISVEINVPVTDQMLGLKCKGVWTPEAHQKRIEHPQEEKGRKDLSMQHTEF
jgi:hypothetical protein